MESRKVKGYRKEDKGLREKREEKVTQNTTKLKMFGFLP